jgi:polysaccharide biosynthesis protein PslJ
VRVVTAMAILAVAAAVGVLAAGKAKYGAAAALVVLAAGVYAASPLIVVGAAIPATWLQARLGGGSSSLSAADLILFLSTIAALPYLRVRESRPLRQLMVVMVIYQLLLLPTLVDNPYRADFVEWGHELFLLVGSIVIGWVVGREGTARPVLSAFLAVSLAIAVAAIIFAPIRHFHPVSLPYGLAKNFTGPMLMIAVILAYANPDWIGWSSRVRWLAICVGAGGILAAQSHQALVGTAVGMLAVAVAQRQLGTRFKVAILIAIPLLALVYAYVANAVHTNNKFDSIHQRLDFYQQSIQIWHVSPWVGVGLRWWYTARFANGFQPPNAELEMLTSAGVLGVAALLILMGRALLITWRMPIAFGSLAFAVLAARFVEGQLDIFWVSGLAAIAWMITGVCLGVMTRSTIGAESRGSSDGELPLASTYPRRPGGTGREVGRDGALSYDSRPGP